MQNTNQTILPSKTTAAQVSKDLITIDINVLQEIIKRAILEYQDTARIKAEKQIKKRTYYLIKRQSKKYGFIYNVKYLDPETGKILPTKFSTGTNDKIQAVQWAEQNKDACLKSYFENGKAELAILENFYGVNSKFLVLEAMDGRKLQDKSRNNYYAFMKRYIIPFFQSKKIQHLNRIKTLHIRELKASLTKKGLSPTTMNQNLNSLKKAFALLKEQELMTTDFSNYNFSTRGGKRNEQKRVIYPVAILNGIFSKHWENNLSKLLCMMIYFTGARNSELLRVCFTDIESLNGVFFLNVRGTKSDNAQRKVPLHPVLYKALEKHITDKGMNKNAAIFKGVYCEVFRQANFAMGELLGYTEKQLINKGICFYSGRHTFKTILTLGNDMRIVDLSVNFVEMFLGHNFSRKELTEKKINEYNYKHIDPETIGNQILAEKGREVINALDHFYF
jgi:integrase